MIALQIEDIRLPWGRFYILSFANIQYRDKLFKSEKLKRLAEKIIRKLLKRIKITASISQDSIDYYRLTIKFTNTLSKSVKFLEDKDVIDMHPELGADFDIDALELDMDLEVRLKSFFRKLPYGSALNAYIEDSPEFNHQEIIHRIISIPPNTVKVFYYNIPSNKLPISTAKNLCLRFTAPKVKINDVLVISDHLWCDAKIKYIN